MDSVRILNIDILNISEPEFLQKLDRGIVYTPNIDHLIKLQKDEEFYNAYKSADWLICDSRVLQKASKLLRQPLREAIPGSSFFQSFCLCHKDNPDCKIFLLGAKEGVALKAQKEINARIGREIIVGAHSPSFGFEKNESECKEIVDIVNNSGANVLLVGVGAPKQEKWIAKYHSQLPNVKIFLALGATIDFEAKTLKRAPKIWQKLCIEWLYRFLCEPKRLFRRYFIEDISFIWLFSKQLLGKYKNPFDK